MTEMNGNAGVPKVLTAAQAVEVVNQQIQLPARIFIRGVIGCSTGVPPNILLPAIARQIGLMLAAEVQSNTVQGASQARADFKKAFEEGMSKVPVIQAPSNVPPMIPVKAM